MAKRRSSRSRGDLGDTAQKIWLAGLGALAIAEREGSKLFGSLVHKGEGVDSALREEVSKTSERLRGEAGKMRRRAKEAWERIEKGVETQVETTLHRLDLPTRTELARLNRKIEELTRRVEELRGRPKPKRARPGTAAK